MPEKPTEADAKRARDLWHAHPSIADLAQFIADVCAEERAAAGERATVAAVAETFPYAADYVREMVQRAKDGDRSTDDLKAIARILAAARSGK